ncbi:hypothetical protein FPOAC2_09902 [Fusarium poae]|uniref:hypothetical protein n=1 Tax=Fusarium poae TaxID=36050 RepID=UPI001CE77740|nr:hypothetical protein FPOAC1_009961 [Fusarium poae]KAG8670539.1 hypothetical protein FPOAC1_009961 [Fusarium poae]
MASQSQHNASNLVRLPNELLADIVEDLLFDCNKWLRHWNTPTFRNLKSLRLVHRTFAECDSFNHLLFRTIVLEPTRATLTCLQRGEFSRVAKYVRCVTFTTPPSLVLPYQEYAKILRDTHRSLVFTSEDLKSGYAAYMTDARDTQALLQDPESELKQAWTKFLKTLGHRIERVKLLSYRCDKIREAKHLDTLSKEDTGKPWQLPRHSHGEKDDMLHFRPLEEFTEPTADYLCKQATAVTGDKLIAMVITCLAASGVAITNFNIKLLMTGDIVCKDIPGWDELDFSKLRVLHLSPEMPASQRYYWGSAGSHAEKMKIMAGGFCHDLLDKCHSSIENFAFGIDRGGLGVLCWPTRLHTLDFPKLIHLAQMTNICPRTLAHWILHSKNLQFLHLSGGVCQGPVKADWRFVFDAIAQHPNVSGKTPKGLKVGFHSLQIASTNLTYHGVICENASIATKRRKWDMRLKHRGEDMKSGLEAHFYGDIPLEENKALLSRIGPLPPDYEDAIQATDGDEIIE